MEKQYLVTITFSDEATEHENEILLAGILKRISEENSQCGNSTAKVSAVELVEEE